MWSYSLYENIRKLWEWTTCPRLNDKLIGKPVLESRFPVYFSASVKYFCLSHNLSSLESVSQWTTTLWTRKGQLVFVSGHYCVPGIVLKVGHMLFQIVLTQSWGGLSNYSTDEETGWENVSNLLKVTLLGVVEWRFMFQSVWHRSPSFHYIVYSPWESAITILKILQGPTRWVSSTNRTWHWEVHLKFCFFFPFLPHFSDRVHS